MNRRQFLASASAVAVAAALPAVVTPARAIDLASDADLTAFWLMESTPGYTGTYFQELYWWVSRDDPQTIRWSKQEPPWWPPSVRYHNADPVMKSSNGGKSSIVVMPSRRIGKTWAARA